jgi:hypothetical protein
MQNDPARRKWLQQRLENLSTLNRIPHRAKLNSKTGNIDSSVRRTYADVRSKG